jgi:hypothetical protein
MQRLSPVRKHQNSAQRDKILRAYQRSALTQKQFAAQAGIGLSTLQWWLRKAEAKPLEESGFVAVPNLLPAHPAAATYRIQWPGGLSLEVRAGFADRELAALLQRLQSL